MPEQRLQLGAQPLVLCASVAGTTRRAGAPARQTQRAACGAGEHTLHAHRLPSIVRRGKALTQTLENQRHAPRACAGHAEGSCSSRGGKPSHFQ